eukprot:Rhum_TRINITY_DN10294_c1_g1::Rhum_TRINITY_DN10294_c1_g1_i1::g.37743::m.37743
MPPSAPEPLTPDPELAAMLNRLQRESSLRCITKCDSAPESAATTPRQRVRGGSACSASGHGGAAGVPPPRRLRPLSVSRTPRGEERPATAEDAAVPFTPRRVGSGQQAQRQQRQQPQSATGRALKTVRSITQAHRLMGLSRRHGTGVFTHRMGTRDSSAHEDDSGIGGVGSATSSGNDGGEPGAIWEVLRAGKGQMALPTAKDLAQLPRTLQKTFKCLAMET